jgi:hypothetical protein
VPLEQAFDRNISYLSTQAKRTVLTSVSLIIRHTPQLFSTHFASENAELQRGGSFAFYNWLATDPLQAVLAMARRYKPPPFTAPSQPQPWPLLPPGSSIERRTPLRSAVRAKSKLAVWLTVCKPCLQELRQWRALYCSKNSQRADWKNRHEETYEDILLGVEQTGLVLLRSNAHLNTSEAGFLRTITISMSQAVDTKPQILVY